MKKNHYKIIISSFIIGIIILTVALFTNQSSDLAFNKNSQLANTGQLALQISQNNIKEQIVGSETTESQTKDYTAISGIDFNAGKNGQSSDSNFFSLLQTIFNWGIAAAVILATLAVVIGSVQYMTTDAVYDKVEGKKRIQSAIGGLILALMSWLILFTINENIFSSNFLLKIKDLKEGNVKNTEQTNGEIESVTPREEYIQNKVESTLASVEADIIKEERDTWDKIKEMCFDTEGNYIDPPESESEELCNNDLIKKMNISEVEKIIKDKTLEILELRRKAFELLERNLEISDNQNLEIETNVQEDMINEEERLE